MSKTICVLGNNGAGKTVFSYFLANNLANKGKRCILVSTNCTVPNVRMVMPKMNRDNAKSLGRLLSLAVIDTESVINNIIAFNNKNVGLISYGFEESRDNYPDITSANMTILFSILHELAEFIIVDTEMPFNAIDQYSLSISDINICISTADMKGMAFRQQLPEAIDVCNILFVNSPYNPAEDIKQTFKLHVKYVMPFCKSLQFAYNGAMLDELAASKKYKQFIDKLVKEVIADE